MILDSQGNVMQKFLGTIKEQIEHEENCAYPVWCVLEKKNG